MPSFTDALPLARLPEAVVACRHCGTPWTGMGEFCCKGCENVFAILGAHGLDEFYAIKDSTYCFQPPQPANWKWEAFGHLDAPELRPRYVNSASEARFFVEGIHCVACLWLLERLPRLAPGLRACRLDVSQSLLTVSLTEGAALAPIAGLIQQLGYRPHALPVDGSAEALLDRERKLSLLRLGVAGACTGNLMLMAVPLYGGATGHWGEVFRWISLGVFLPVVAFAAVPFYRTAVGALRSRQINIDVPIVLAILLGALMSTYNLATGSPHIYFDSLGALVFLLLASRYYLKEVQARTARASQLLQSFFAPIAHLLDGDTRRDVPPERLQIDDLVEVIHGERLPADGIVATGATEINAAWLTGEALPVTAREGDPVYAGTLNEGPDFILRVTEALQSSRLGKLLQDLERPTRAPIIGMTDQVARVFLAAVLLVAAAVFAAFLRSDPAEGLNRALSLLIVTCPCALALATPLTFSHALARAYQKGYAIKSGETLERLAQVRTIFFDKTGTLTHGELAVEGWEDLDGDPDQNRRLLLTLEASSLHPIARALRHHLGSLEALEVKDAAEVAGQGVQGTFEGRRLEARSLPDPDATSTCIGLLDEGRLRARVRFRDTIRAEAAATVASLQELGCDVGLLSGDAPAVVRRLAREAGVEPARAMAALSPEAKHKVIAATPFSLMVGDGANDALALQNAHVGVAMHGGMDISLKVADVYLAQPDLGAIRDLLVLGRETRKVLWRNFGLSLAYNLAGGVAAAAGWINPLVAAVIMPLSSITVLLSSTLSTRRVRALFRARP